MPNLFYTPINTQLHTLGSRRVGCMNKLTAIIKKPATHHQKDIHSMTISAKLTYLVQVLQPGITVKELDVMHVRLEGIARLTRLLGHSLQQHSKLMSDEFQASCCVTVQVCG